MIAWVFPGQGSQFVGMGAGLDTPAAREVFAIAGAVLGKDLRAICLNGPAELLDSTEVSQPAILTVSVAAARSLEASGVLPDLVAGHSVGEFAALVAAHAIAFEEALRVVAARAEAMGRAGRSTPGRMAAVVGLPVERVAELCERSHGIVSVATVNTADQVVISGEVAAVEAVGEAARAAGARRVIPLAVSVAAHSPLMATAAEALREELARISILSPLVPYASCVSGRVEEHPEEIARLLAAGVTHTVNWPACVGALRHAGADTFVEVGPGTVVSGLVRRIVPDARVVSVGSDADVAALERDVASGVTS